MGEVTARARTLPDLMRVAAEEIDEPANCRCPPIRSARAGADPLYGTCCILNPASCCSISIAICTPPPVPEVP
ncbi:hypothetical protein D3C72_1919490 [compost metagenome]